MATFQILEETEAENVPIRSKFAKSCTNFLRELNQHPFRILFGILCFVGVIAFMVTQANKLSEIRENQAKLSDRIDHIDYYQIPRLDQKIDNGTKSNFHSKVASARSCKEYQDHGYKKDGYYLVDPDGRYQGHNSLEVYCENMDKDYHNIRTIIKPKNATKTFLGNATKAELFKLTYEASMAQLNTLVRNSGNCYQKMAFHCYRMPLHLNNTGIGYWVDYDNTDWTYFEGSDWQDQKCERGKFNRWQNRLCNCDQYDSEADDHGTITAQSLLPIQGFGYDATKIHHKNGSLEVKIEPLICEEEFELTLGSLSDLAQLQIEKVFWNQWRNLDLNALVFIDLSLINATDKRCKKVLEILDIGNVKENSTFFEFSVCHVNLTFTRNINGTIRQFSVPLDSPINNHNGGDRYSFKVRAKNNHVEVVQNGYEARGGSVSKYWENIPAFPKKSQITIWKQTPDSFLNFASFHLENYKRWW